MNTPCKMIAAREAASRASSEVADRVTVDITTLHDYVEARGDTGVVLGDGTYAAVIRYELSGRVACKHVLANDDPFLAVARVTEHAIRLFHTEPRAKLAALKRLYTFQQRFQELASQKAVVFRTGKAGKLKVVFDEEIEFVNEP